MTIAFTPGGLAETPVTQADPVAEIVSRFLGYGLAGAIAIVLAWVLYKGKFVTSDAATSMVTAARADLLKENEHVRSESARAVEAGRADLLAENERLRARADKAEGQREELMRFLQGQLIPMMGNFTSSTTNLLPILQELTRYREHGPPELYRRGDARDDRR